MGVGALPSQILKLWPVTVGTSEVRINKRVVVNYPTPTTKTLFRKELGSLNISGHSPTQ